MNVPQELEALLKAAMIPNHEGFDAMKVLIEAVIPLARTVLAQHKALEGKHAKAIKANRGRRHLPPCADCAALDLSELGKAMEG